MYHNMSEECDLCRSHWRICNSFSFLLYTVFTDLNWANSARTWQTDMHVVLSVSLFLWIWCREEYQASAGLEKGRMFSPSSSLRVYIMLKKAAGPNRHLFCCMYNIISWYTSGNNYPNTHKHEYLLDHRKLAYCVKVKVPQLQYGNQLGHNNLGGIQYSNWP